MAAPVRLLPQLDPAPFQVPFVDLKTGLITDAWQRYFINLQRVIFGVWTDQPFDAANFTTDTVGITWNVIAGNVNQLAFFQMGNYAVLVFSIIATTVSADVATLRVTIPTLRQKADSSLKVFANTCIAQVLPAGPPVPTELASVAVVNVPAEQALQLSIARLDGVLWPVAALSISVIGMVIAEVVSVVTP